MSHISNVYRRPSGIYAVRLVVPERLRATIGKREVHQSTGTRTLAVAKAVACGLLAHWREKFLSLERMDLNRLILGSPRLIGGGFLRLAEAAVESGFTEDDLLRMATEGRLSLYVQVVTTWGHFATYASLQSDLTALAAAPSGPPPMPLDAVYECFTGVLRIRRPRELATKLVNGPICLERLFDQLNPNEFVFVSDDLIDVTRGSLHLSAAEVEFLRQETSKSLTSEQRESAKFLSAPVSCKGTTAHISTYIEKYLKYRAESIKPDQIRQIRNFLELFCEMECDPIFAEFDNEKIARFRDEKLVEVPDREEKLRAKLKTTRVTETIKLVRGTDYKRLTPRSIQKRIQWLLAFREWIKNLSKMDGSSLSKSGAATNSKKKTRPDEARPKFAEDDLKLIFSAEIFQNGRGNKNKAGTFREYLPWHYWGPLICLLSGMRPNECCQMNVEDIRQIDDVWCFDINEDTSEDPSHSKSIKTISSKRVIPIHPKLIELGLIGWRNKLSEAGHVRLWEEWIAHSGNGRYSPMASRWFNDTFRKQVFKEGFDTKKVLYSFRHTFITELFNLGFEEREVNKISGHSPGKTESSSRYDKNKDTKAVSKIVSKLDFDLSSVKPFDIDSGLKALQDALRRKTGCRLKATSPQNGQV